MLTITVAALLSLLVAARTYAAPLASPSVTINAPSDVPIGGSFTLNVAFNTTSTGYGPFIDLILPRNGADGNFGTDTPDGITFGGASYLGAPVTTQVLTFPGSGGITCVDHPYAVDNTNTPLQVCGPAGDQLVVMLLPFGSFVPAQSPATVQVTLNVSNLADVGSPLPIQARAGFRFGADPLNNPTTDPSIVSGYQTTSITPQVLINAGKEYVGPEDETATGPNYVRQYVVNADIAPGQTFSPFTLTDFLPNTIAYWNALTASPGGYTVLDQPPLGVAQNPPNNDVIVRWAPLSADPSFQFDFFVPLTDANGLPVLNPLTGAFRNLVNEVRAAGNWVPTDARDLPLLVTRTITNAHVLEAQSIAIQKSAAIVEDNGAPGLTPGDVVEYVLDFQVSDFFAFNNIIISDTLGDGQRLTTTFTPTLSVNGNGYTLPSAPFAAANYNVYCQYSGGPGPECDASGPPIDGTTQISFFVSLEQVLRGVSDRLIGGCINPATGSTPPNCAAYNDGATTGQVRFRVVIQDTFSDDFPSGDQSVDAGDELGNRVNIFGDVLTTTLGFTPTGFTVRDDSAAQLTIAEDEPEKTIYAVNGVVCSPQPCTSVRVSPGYSVTFRIRLGLFTSDYENLTIADYLPLPVFDATSLTTFDPTVIAATPPPVGVARFGPAETLSTTLGIYPTMTVNAAQNSVLFDWGTFDDPLNRPSSIDVLFTVQVLPDPFADGLFLTNQIRQERQSTNSGDARVDRIVQFVLDEPEVVIGKGVVASSNPAVTFSPPVVGPVPFSAPPSTACPRFAPTIHSVNLITNPVNSDAQGADTGDLLTFAVVVQNLGHYNAFDVRLRDLIPPGLAIPPGGANLCVTYGDGTPATYVSLGGGFFDPAGGIELVDAGGVGALAPGKFNDVLTTSGRNLVVVTFDLIVSPSVTLNHTLTNTAVLSNYAGTEGGPNHVPGSLTEIASVSTQPPRISKALVDSELTNAHNSILQVVIGELVTYTVLITVPEGVLPAAVLTDTLDAGLAFVDVVTFTTSPSVTVQNPIGTGASPANVTVSGAGSVVVFNFGAITNTDSTTVTALGFITLTYRAVVLNVIGNQSSVLLNNSAQFGWSNGATSTAASDVVVVEPALQVAKLVTPTSGDAGDLVTFTIVLTNPAAGSTVAYDVVLSDVVPAGLVYEPGTWTHSGGLAPTALSDAAAPVLTATWDAFTPGITSTLRFAARLSDTVIPGQVITNVARVFWSSLPGDPGQRSIHNADSRERDGSGGVNDYTNAANRSVAVHAVQSQKALVATSEAHTSGNAVAIGEIVRYRLAVRFPEGIIPDFRLLDGVPTGLQFLNDGSARCAFVANTAITSTALAGIPAVSCTPIVSSSLTLAQVLSTGVIPSSMVAGTFDDLNISASATSNNDSYGDGTDVYFKLGNLENGDRDADDEFIVVEMNLLVRNVSGNTAGTTRNNNFQTLSSTVQLTGTSNNVSVVIREPQLVLSKSVTPTVGGYGTTLTYTLFVSAATGTNRTTAFDVLITDVLPSGLFLNSGSIISSSATPVNCAAPISHTVNGNTFTVTVGQQPPGCGLSITFTAQLTSALPGQVFTNSAGLIYTTLPATGTVGNPTGSNTPGASGQITGERVYSGTAVATVSADLPQASKVLMATDQPHTNGSNVVVGEVITYLIAITLPETDIPSLVITDDLPVGLAVLDTQVFTQSFDGQFSPGDPTTVISGSTVVFTFANPITPTVDNDPTDNVVTFTIRAVVSNAVSNQEGAVLTNTASVQVAGQPPQSTSPVAVSVREPALALSKQNAPPLPLFGETVYFTLTVSHLPTSTVDAFDLVITDTLPAGLIYVPGSAAFTGGVVDESGYPPTLVFSRTALALGGVATITYQAQVSEPPTVTVGTLLTNTAFAHWTSTPGDNPFERDGSGGLNDYLTPARSTVMVGGADVQVAKSDAPDPVVAGGLLTYTLVVTNAGPSVAGGVVVTDALPAEVSYVSAAPAPTSVGGGLVVWNLGALAVGEVRVLTVTVAVSAGVADGMVITNSVVVTSATPNGDPTNNVDDEPTTVSTSADVQVSKADVPDPVVPGGLLTYTLVVTNAGPSVAGGVVVTDVLPAEVSYVSAVPAPTSVSGGLVVWSLGDLAVGEVRVLTVTVAVSAGVVDGTVITNSVVVTTTTPDGDPTNNADDEPTTVSTSADVQVSKADVPDPVVAGGLLTYTLVVTNGGPSVAGGVVVTDVLPAEVSYVSAVPAPASVSGGLVVWSLGDLAVGEVRVLTVTVAVSAGVADGTVITNSVVVTSTTPDGDPTNNADDEPTTVLRPSIAVLKTAEPTEVTLGMPITFTIRVTNTGLVTLTDVVVTDTLQDPGLSYITGSASPTPSLVSPPLLVWSLGTLSPGSSVVITFQAVANTPDMPPYRENRVLVGGIGDTLLVTDDDRVELDVLGPEVAIDKALVGVDLDNVAPNHVTFTIRITNTGISPIATLAVQDQFDGNVLTYTQATPQPNFVNADLLVWTNLLAPAPHGYSITLQPSESVVITVTFRVIADITSTTNIARVTQGTQDIYGNYTNQPEDDAEVINVPTAVTLRSFGVQSVIGRQVTLAWETEAEVDNFAFRIYRAPTNNFAQAVQVAQVPAAMGGASGASYAHTDEVPADGVWWYWLADVSTSDVETVHTPAAQARVGVVHRAWLPLIMR